MVQVLQSPSEVSRKIFARVRVIIVMVTSYVLILFYFIILPHTMNYKQNKNDNKQVN